MNISKAEKINNKINLIRVFFSLTILLVMFLGMISFFVIPKKHFSENENRVLSSKPEFRVSNVFSGNFSNEINDYINDHFALREELTSLKTGFEMLLNKPEINNIYMAKDGYYIEKYSTPVNTDAKIYTIKNFANNLKASNIHISMMLVPTAITIYDDKLPAFEQTDAQTETINYIYDNVKSAGINTIDVTPALYSNKDNYKLFYKYDHHWTSYGAYIGYEEYCKDLGFDCTDIDKIVFKTVCKDFKGTIYSKILAPGIQGEEIEALSEEDIYGIVSADTNNSDVATDAAAIGAAAKTTITTDSKLYNEDYLKTKDKYSYFLDGIKPYIELTNPNSATDRGLAIIKDSYANCMIPFLLKQYRKIYVYDTRYYRSSVSADIMSKPDITDVLMLYNINTFDTDTGINNLN